MGASIDETRVRVGYGRTPPPASGEPIVVGIARDPIERKRAEAAAQSDAQFQRVWECALDGMRLTDADGLVLRVNGAYCRMMGRPRSAIEDRPMSEPYPEGEHAAILEEYRRRFRERDVPAHQEVEILLEGGQRRCVEMACSFLPSPDGSELLLSVFRDISERKEAERAVARQRDSLETLIAERARRHEELRSLSQQLVVAEEQERRRLATELHDQVGQSLALAQIKLGALRKAAGNEHAAAITEVRGMIDQAIRASRSLTMELGATVLRELGLAAALESLANETEQPNGLKCMFLGEPISVPLSEEVQIALFRGARELLVNVAKHANARQVEIALRHDGRTLALRVADDGVGFEAAPEEGRVPRSGGFGLFSIQERLARLGGSMHVESRRGVGTCVTLEVPHAADPAGEANS